MIENITGNTADTGGMVTFKDSSWLLSVVVTPQPYFKTQQAGQVVLWGYCLYTGHVGDYIKKTMRDCSGEEILEELIYHLHLQDKVNEIKGEIMNVIPCLLPYVTAQFQPRKMSDRPAVVPPNSRNFAIIGQFVEVPKDMVFTGEYSVRGAKTAVYSLLGLSDTLVSPVSSYKWNPKVMAKAMIASY